MRIRLLKNLLFKIVITLFALAAICPIFFILFFILKNGLPVISWEFLFNLPAPVGTPGGGILNSLLGSILILAFSTIVAIPLGIACGLFLATTSHQRLKFFIRNAVELLGATPSIVIGIFAYTWFVLPFHKFSALSGTAALAMMLLPMVIVATEETFALLPKNLVESAMALGVPYYRAVLKVLLPSAASGILTGVLLGLSRIAGETAPLLFTAFGSPYLVLNPTEPINTLPLLIYNYALSPYEEWQAQAWGASLILILLIFLLNLLSKWMRTRWTVQF